MRRLTMIGLVGAALLAGCGSDDSGSSSGSTSGSDSGSAIPVSLTDFKIDPSTLSPREGGTVTFSVINKGPSQHALEIEGNGIEEETETLSSGDHADLTVDLKPGTYEMYCPIDGHRDRGMECTIVVRGGSGTSGTTTDDDSEDSDDSDDSSTGSGYGYG
jgi:plastocyanin